MTLLRLVRPIVRLNTVAPFMISARHLSFTPIYTAESTVVGAR